MPTYIPALSSQKISYAITTPANTVKKPISIVNGPNFKAPPVVVVKLMLLVALAGLVALVGMGGVPKLLRLVNVVCEILTGPGPVGIIVLRMLNGKRV
jgi:hypothetical protein